VTIEKRARQTRCGSATICNRHDRTERDDARATQAGPGAPTSRGWIRTPFPRFGPQYGPRLAPRKGTSEDCEWRFLQRRCKFTKSLHQIFELGMCALSHTIREKPNWWEKMKDEVIVEKWRGEALQEEKEGEESPTMKLTPTMVKFSYSRTTPTPVCLLLYPDQLRTRGTPRIRISTRSGDWGRSMVRSSRCYTAELTHNTTLGWSL